MNEDEREEAMVELLTGVQLPLRAYVRSLLPGDPAAGDVTQQANATIWRKRADFEPGTHFKAWAFSIARFEVLNYRKRQARDARLVFSGELEEVFAEEMGREDDASEARHAALRHCLAGLRSRHRELLLHRYAGGATLQEFADRSGRSVAGLKVTLHRLRSTLLDCMRRRMRLGVES